jgi:hypothetical protein
MTTSYPPYPISEELQAAGVVFRDDFTNADLSVANGTSFIGSPHVNNGVFINAAFKYVRYNGPKFNTATKFSIVFEFIPNFEFNNGFNHYLFSSWPNVQLALLKNSTNTLTLYVAGIPLFTSGVFGSYWKTNKKNTLIISAKSGDTSVWLNGFKVIDSDSSAFGQYVFEYINIFARYDGSIGATGVIKKFVFINNAIDDLDAAQWESGGLDLDFSVRGRTVRQECLLGSDGKTAGEMPTIIRPRGGLLHDGGDFSTVLDSPELTFIDDSGDKPFSINVSFQSGNHTTLAGIVSKWTGTQREWVIFQNGSNKIAFYTFDENNVKAILCTVNSDLITGKLENWTFVCDGKSLSSSLIAYRNGILAPSTNSIQAGYIQMRNTTTPIEVGSYDGNHLPAGSEIRALQLWDKQFSSQQAKVWSYLAKSMRIR